MVKNGRFRLSCGVILVEVLLALYAALMLVIGILGLRRVRTAEDYLLAGRRSRGRAGGSLRPRPDASQAPPCEWGRPGASFRLPATIGGPGSDPRERRMPRWMTLPVLAGWIALLAACSAGARVETPTTGAEPITFRLHIEDSGNALRMNPLLQWAAEEVLGLPMRLSPFREEAAVGAALNAAGLLPRPQ